jgi:hypothetical protein
MGLADRRRYVDFVSPHCRFSITTTRSSAGRDAVSPINIRLDPGVLSAVINAG